MTIQTTLPEGRKRYLLTRLSWTSLHALSNLSPKVPFSLSQLILESSLWVLSSSATLSRTLRYSKAMGLPSLRIVERGFTSIGGKLV